MLEDYLNAMISRSDHSQLEPDVVDVGLTDHRLVSACIDFTPLLPLYETRTSRSWRYFDLNTYHRDLKDSILCTDDDRTSSVLTALVDI